MPYERLQRLEEHDRRYARLVILFGVLVLCLMIGNAWAIYLIQQQGDKVQRTADQNQKALCAYREDLGRRIEDGRAFLKANPDGLVLGGSKVSAAQLAATINNQQHAYDALGSVDCD